MASGRLQLETRSGTGVSSSPDRLFLFPVRILAPQRNSHIRPGRTVKVIVRVSKTEGDNSDELETPESFPSGWTLVLSQDGGPTQALGPKSGHIGDFRGLTEGPHLIR